MQCLISGIPFSISVHGFSRRASAANEKIFLECTGILANVQGKIGAPYRDMTQIGWQVWVRIIEGNAEIRVGKLNPPPGLNPGLTTV